MPKVSAALFFALILGLSLPVFASPQAPDDNEACAHMLPEALRIQVLKDHPGYRFLRVDDYSAEDIQSERQYHHGSPCLAAASGDYFGDHHPAYAFMLLSSTSYGLVLVAHQTAAGQWDIQKMGEDHVGYTKGSFNRFVNTIPAGSYTDATVEEGADPKELAKDANWRQDLTSATPGIAMGILEAWEVAYFLKDGHWLFTNVSD